MPGDKNVNKNIIFNMIKSLLGIIYPMITFPYISRVLMAENVGRINFGNSVISYFSLFASLGVTTYAVRECSKYRDNRKKLGEVASQIFSINILSTIIAYAALAVTLIIARNLDSYRTLICIQSATILFTTVGADWMNTAMEDFKFIAIRTMAMQVVSLLLMFLFVKKPEDYLLYALISVIASSGANIINIFYRRKYCRTRLTIHMDLRKHLPPVMMLFSLVLSQTIYTNSDTTILGLIRGDFEVGLYSTSVKMYNIVNTVVASVAWVVMPQLSEKFAKKNYAEINRLLKHSLNFIIVIGLPCIVGLNVITKEVICLLAGKEYLGAVTSLRILTIALACSYIGGWIGNMIMLPSGREKVALKASIISALVNVVLNLVFIPIWGLNAAAATTAAAEFVSLLICVRFIEKEIKIDKLGELLKAPVAGCTVIVVIGFMMKYFIHSEYLVAIVTPVFSVAIYVFILVTMKNEFFLGFVKPVVEKLKGGR